MQILEPNLHINVACMYVCMCVCVCVCACACACVCVHSTGLVIFLLYIEEFKENIQQCLSVKGYLPNNCWYVAL
jgi:hypothetical protein